jgi:hypothetical protein
MLYKTLTARIELKLDLCSSLGVLFRYVPRYVL